MCLRRRELHAPPYNSPERRVGQLGLPDEHQPRFPTRLQRLDGFLVRFNTLNKHIGLLAEAGRHRARVRCSYIDGCSCCVNANCGSSDCASPTAPLSGSCDANNVSHSTTDSRSPRCRLYARAVYADVFTAPNRWIWLSRSAPQLEPERQYIHQLYTTRFSLNLDRNGPSCDRNDEWMFNLLRTQSPYTDASAWVLAGFGSFLSFLVSRPACTDAPVAKARVLLFPLYSFPILFAPFPSRLPRTLSLLNDISHRLKRFWQHSVSRLATQSPSRVLGRLQAQAEVNQPALHQWKSIEPYETLPRKSMSYSYSPCSSLSPQSRHRPRHLSRRHRVAVAYGAPRQPACVKSSPPSQASAKVSHCSPATGLQLCVTNI